MAQEQLYNNRDKDYNEDAKIDVNYIIKDVEKKHNDFQKTYENDIQGVFTYNIIKAKKMFSRIYLVADIFRRQGVIDSIQSGLLGEYQKITMSKNNIDTQVEIYTNGNEIVLLNNNLLIATGIESSFKSKIKINDTPEFWNDFSNTLLGYCHAVIYQIKAVQDTHVKNIFRNTNG